MKKIIIHTVASIIIATYNGGQRNSTHYYHNVNLETHNLKNKCNKNILYFTSNNYITFFPTLFILFYFYF